MPSAPINDEARRRNRNLPGMGGIYNTINMHAYAYTHNNPINLTDPDGRKPKDEDTARAINDLGRRRKENIDYSIKQKALIAAGGFNDVTPERASEIAIEIRADGALDNEYWEVSIVEITLPPIGTVEIDSVAVAGMLNDLLIQGHTGSRNERLNDKDIEKTITFDIRIYEIRMILSDGNLSPTVSRQYVDLNKDGHIDGEIINW